MMNPVTRALFKRDLRRWFGNPTGYVFITLFVILSTAALFWPDQFFQQNLASLDSLNRWFPLLLLFFIPAVTMNIWAGERSQGTDELLLTLPATDWQVVAGKYLAALGIYTVALLFTTPILIFLAYLGSPDWGLLASNYFAFWLLGATLISAGMVGSQLSDNLTVAFILGAILCGILVMFETFLQAIFPEFARTWSGFGPTSLFQELGRGVISLPAILFFTGVTGAFLYLNLVFLGRRQWKHRVFQSIHHLIRFACVLVAVAALTGIGANAGSRMDMTSEGVHSLSDETVRLIESLPGDRPVYIQAFVSPEVPREYVQTRRTLIDLLGQYNALGGDRIRVRIVDTERFSEESREARDNFGIIPQTRLTEEHGRTTTEDIFLGLAFTSGLEEVVVPFLDRGLPTEYELTRAIRVVASADRKRVGVLDNDVRAFGGLDFQVMRQTPEWDIVTELKTQYEVVRVAPGQEYPPNLDVLVALMPSSLTQEEMDRLRAYIEEGNPALLIDDPFPAAAPMLAPANPKSAQQNPMMGMQQPPEEKGNILQFFQSLGVNWMADASDKTPGPSVAWDSYNPYPQFEFDPEIMFVSSANPAAFNQDEAVTSGLQQVVTIFGGAVEESPGTGLTFTPLIRSSKLSGTLGIQKLFRMDPFFGPQLDPRRRHKPDGMAKTLAAHITGQAAGADAAIDVIFIADLDMVSSQFFEMRRRGLEDMNFDNVTFILNCVDQLASDTSYIDLRKRRARHRTLTEIEAQAEAFNENWLEKKEDAEKKAEKSLKDAQKRLDEKVTRIEQRTDLDDQSKAVQVQSVREVEQRRLDVRKQRIEDEKSMELELALSEKLGNEDQIRDFYRLGAVAITPIPAILFGLIIFLRRRKREAGSEPPDRRANGGAA